MLTIDIQTTLVLEAPSDDDGFVTWLQADVVDDEAGEGTERVGHAHVAVVHVGLIADAGRAVHEVLAADGGELAGLHDTYFEDGWLRGDLTGGGGGASDLLYVSELALAPAYAGMNVDVAVVRRLCDTVGVGCGLAVLPSPAHDDLARWIAAGFKVTRPVGRRGAGYLHRDTSLRVFARCASVSRVAADAT